MTPEGQHVRSEDSLKRRGQRRINVIWEATQAAVALGVTGVTLTAALMVIHASTVNPTDARYHEMTIFLTNVFFVVIGFYFGRTNHQRTGGVGGEEAGSRSL